MVPCQIRARSTGHQRDVAGRRGKSSDVLQLGGLQLSRHERDPLAVWESVRPALTATVTDNRPRRRGPGRDRGGQESEVADIDGQRRTVRPGLTREGVALRGRDNETAVMTTSPKSPWWQVTKTPKQGFVLGGGWVVFALGWWVELAINRGDSRPMLLLRVFLALLATALAAACLVSAVLLRRRRQAPTKPDAGAGASSH